MTIYALVAAGLLVAACSPRNSDAHQDARAAAASDENALLPHIARAMAQIQSAELISLEPLVRPEAPGERLKGYLILGTTKLSPDDARAAVNVITSAVRSFDGMSTACFDPRHALRFHSAGHVYLVLVCFDCGSLRVFEDERQIGSADLTGSSAELNKMLAAAKVPISHSAEELEAKTRGRAGGR